MLILRPVDPSLTLTRMQYPAIVSNRENRKPLNYAGLANSCNPQQPLTTHSYLEQVSGSSPLVGSLFYLQILQKQKSPR